MRASPCTHTQAEPASTARVTRVQRRALHHDAPRKAAGPIRSANGSGWPSVRKPVPQRGRPAVPRPNRNRDAATGDKPLPPLPPCETRTRYSSVVEQAEQEVVRGFPAALRADAETVVELLPRPWRCLGADAHRVVVQGEALEIPVRIYTPDPPILAARRRSVVQRLIAGCVDSRNSDGYVRQAACAHILPSAEPWVVPYVIQLLGEYVVEISALILEGLSAQSSFEWPAYRDFVAANGEYMALTEQRAISYWSCYYRPDYRRVEYPALVALDKLRHGAAV